MITSEKFLSPSSGDDTQYIRDELLKRSIVHLMKKAGYVAEKLENIERGEVECFLYRDGTYIVYPDGYYTILCNDTLFDIDVKNNGRNITLYETVHIPF